jgi:hypothetical protein
MGQPTTYRILVDGQLGPEWTRWFSGLAVRPGPDGTTVLRGQLADQAALHGLLAAIRDLGLSLVSVETITQPGPGWAERCLVRSGGSAGAFEQARPGGNDHGAESGDNEAR